MIVLRSSDTVATEHCGAGERVAVGRGLIVGETVGEAVGDAVGDQSGKLEHDRSEDHRDRHHEADPHGGVTVGIDLTPLGWSRLFRVRADLFRDRVVPLETMLPHGWVTSVFGRLLSSNQSTQVKPILDELLLAIMPPPGVDDAMIVAIQRFIAEDGTAPDLGAAAAALGLTPAALRRLSIRHFGFPPKTLLIRTRFIRSLVRMLLAGERADYTVMAPSYFDVSHFIRDANRFLGMTPRRFLQYDHRYLIACLRADQEVRRAALAQSGESRRYPATRPENAPLLP